jgi:hypothetical protein
MSNSSSSGSRNSSSSIRDCSGNSTSPIVVVAVTVIVAAIGVVVVVVVSFLKVAAPVHKSESNGRGDPLRLQRDTLYPLKLALTSPTSGGSSAGRSVFRAGTF